MSSSPAQETTTHNETDEVATEKIEDEKDGKMVDEEQTELSKAVASSPKTGRKEGRFGKAALKAFQASALTSTGTYEQIAERGRRLREAAGSPFLDLRGLRMAFPVPAEIVGLKFVLEKIDVSDNEMRMLPPALARMLSLKELDISQNLLSSLPDKIGMLGRLEVLVCTHNTLVSITKEIGKLSALTRLDLSFNLLCELPDEVSSLKKLQCLDLQSNNLKTVDNFLPSLTGATDVNLFNNSLVKLPEKLGSLKSLTALNAQNNILDALPPSLFRLPKLALVRADNNAIRELPESIGEAKSLRVLSLSDNELTSLPPSMASIQRLTRLHLRNNAISILPLFRLTSLEVLDLDYERIVSPPKQIWEKGLDSMMSYLSRLHRGLHGEKRRRKKVVASFGPTLPTVLSDKGGKGSEGGLFAASQPSSLGLSAEPLLVSRASFVDGEASSVQIGAAVPLWAREGRERERTGERGEGKREEEDVFGGGWAVAPEDGEEAARPSLSREALPERGSGRGRGVARGREEEESDEEEEERAGGELGTALWATINEEGIDTNGFLRSFEDKMERDLFGKKGKMDKKKKKEEDERMIGTFELSSLSLQFLPVEILRPPLFDIVVVLSLDNNKLTRIPDRIDVLKNVRRLSLNNNRIRSDDESIPASLCSLRFLRVLELDGNELTTVPKHLLFCDREEVVERSDGRENTDDSENELYLEDLKKRQESDGEEEVLRVVSPPSFDSVPPFLQSKSPVPAAFSESLTSLSLRRNRIAWLPEELGLLSSLKSLRLEGNPPLFEPTTAQIELWKQRRFACSFRVDPQRHLDVCRRLQSGEGEAFESWEGDLEDNAPKSDTPKAKGGRNRGGRGMRTKGASSKDFTVFRSEEEEEAVRREDVADAIGERERKTALARTIAEEDEEFRLVLSAEAVVGRAFVHPVVAMMEAIRISRWRGQTVEEYLNREEKKRQTAETAESGQKEKEIDDVAMERGKEKQLTFEEVPRCLIVDESTPPETLFPAKSREVSEDRSDLSKGDGPRGVDSLFANPILPPKANKTVLSAEAEALSLQTSLQPLTLNATAMLLEEFPSHFLRLRHLRSLWLGKNELRRLPDDLDLLSNLRSLRVEHNRLAELPRTAMRGLSGLTELWLHSNDLRNCGVSVLRGFTSLESLSLEGNYLLHSPPPFVVRKGHLRTAQFVNQLNRLNATRLSKERPTRELDLRGLDLTAFDLASLLFGPAFALESAGVPPTIVRASFSVAGRPSVAPPSPPPASPRASSTAAVGGRRSKSRFSLTKRRSFEGEDGGEEGWPNSKSKAKKQIDFEGLSFTLHEQLRVAAEDNARPHFVPSSSFDRASFSRPFLRLSLLHEEAGNFVIEEVIEMPEDAGVEDDEEREEEERKRRREEEEEERKRRARAEGVDEELAEEREMIERRMRAVNANVKKETKAKVREAAVEKELDSEEEEEARTKKRRSRIDEAKVYKVPFYLRSLPDLPDAEVERAGEITHLLLDRTRVKAIPKWIPKLESLRVLSIRDTPVKKLPIEIGELKDLEEVRMDEQQWEAVGTRDRRVAGVDLSTVVQTKERKETKLSKFRNAGAKALRKGKREGKREGEGGVGEEKFERGDGLPWKKALGQYGKISEARRTKELSLRSEDIGVLPADVLTLTSLTCLDIADNHLPSLCVDFGDSLRCLTAIDASQNMLSALPLSLRRCSSLQSLNISGNAFADVPPVVAHCSSLTLLDIARNRIHELPESVFASLLQLETFRFGYNFVDRLPRAIGSCTSLRVLSFAANGPWKDPEESVLERGAQNVVRYLRRFVDAAFDRHLDLSGFGLTEIPAAVPDVRSLEKLDLSDNAVVSPSPEFILMTALTDLNLDNNGIHELDPLVLPSVSSLTRLSLRNNAIRSLPMRMALLTRLKELLLDGKPLSCPPKRVVEKGTQSVMDFLSVNYRYEGKDETHRDQRFRTYRLPPVGQKTRSAKGQIVE